MKSKLLHVKIYDKAIIDKHADGLVFSGLVRLYASNPHSHTNIVSLIKDNQDILDKGYYAESIRLIARQNIALALEIFSLIEEFSQDAEEAYAALVIAAVEQHYPNLQALLNARTIKPETLYLIQILNSESVAAALTQFDLAKNNLQNLSDIYAAMISVYLKNNKVPEAIKLYSEARNAKFLNTAIYMAVINGLLAHKKSTYAKIAWKYLAEADKYGFMNEDFLFEIIIHANELDHKLFAHHVLNLVEKLSSITPQILETIQRNLSSQPYLREPIVPIEINGEVLKPADNNQQDSTPTIPESGAISERVDDSPAQTPLSPTLETATTPPETTVNVSAATSSTLAESAATTSTVSESSTTTTTVAESATLASQKSAQNPGYMQVETAAVTVEKGDNISYAREVLRLDDSVKIQEVSIPQIAHLLMENDKQPMQVDC